MARPLRTTLSGIFLLLLCTMAVLAAGTPAGRKAQPQPQAQHAPASAGMEQRHNTSETGSMANTTHAAGPGGNTTAVSAQNATTTVNTTARRLLRDGKTKGTQVLGAYGPDDGGLELPPTTD